jgi:hypothetical protein
MTAQYYIAVVHAFVCAGEHKHHRTKPRKKPAQRRGGQSSGKGSGGKSNIHCHALSDNSQIEVFIFDFFRCGMQANKTLTNLNLKSNKLGPEGGIAIAKSLEVNLPFSVLSLSL